MPQNCPSEEVAGILSRGAQGSHACVPRVTGFPSIPRLTVLQSWVGFWQVQKPAWLCEEGGEGDPCSSAPQPELLHAGKDLGFADPEPQGEVPDRTLPPLGCFLRLSQIPTTL